MFLRLTTTALLGLLVCAPSGAAQSLTLTPDGTVIRDITPDGEIVVGQASGGGFIWRWREDPTPTYITGGTSIVATSDDGSVLAGTMDDPLGSGAEVAAIWTEAGGWQSLGYLPNALNCPSKSNAYDISGDGTTVVGLSWDGCNGRGFVWTQATGMMQELDVLANGHNRASAIAGDGSVIGGFAQGTFNRTPAFWNPDDTTGFVLDVNFQGEVYGFNQDGSVSVGTNYFSGSAYSAFYKVGNAPMTNLGSLQSGWAAAASDISEDGLVIVGFDYLQLGRVPWIWTPITGIVNLDDFVSDLGILNAPTLLIASKVSDDGNVVVGSAAGSLGLPNNGFILEISDTETWANPGGGTPGLNGVPTLDGWGGLVPDTPFYIQMQQARGSALTLLWLAAPSNPIQVFGGTLHAFPPVPGTELFLNTNGDGEFLGGALWPAGLPAGTEITFQFLIDDPFAFPWGINMSDGLRATTP